MNFFRAAKVPVQPASPLDLWGRAERVVDALPTDLKRHLNGLKAWHPTSDGGTSPLSSHTMVAGAIALYFITIYTGQAIMASRTPLQLRPLFVLHNALLSTGSFIVLALMVEQVAPLWWKGGLFSAICADASWTSILYIINYLFKYWELLDTLFLVAKKKPLQFLHVYHHTATALLCYTQLNGKTSVSWVPISLNLTVHVLMYYYYGVTALFPGKKIWWKRYLTTMQILQFVVDLFAIYYATYSYFAAQYAPWLPTQGSCSGTETAALFGCGILSSYLFLFIAFYQRTYKEVKQAQRAGKRRHDSVSFAAAAQAASGEGPEGGVDMPIPPRLRGASFSRTKADGGAKAVKSK